MYFRTGQGWKVNEQEAKRIGRMTMRDVVENTWVEKDVLSMVPRPLQPIAATSTSASPTEDGWFVKRVEKAIRNKDCIDEFFTLCTLFSQDFMDRYTFIHHSRAIVSDNPDLIKAFLDLLGTLGSKGRTIENEARRPFEAKEVYDLNVDGLKRIWRAPGSYSLPGRRNEDGRSANQERMVVATPEMVEVTR